MILFLLSFLFLYSFFLVVFYHLVTFSPSPISQFAESLNDAGFGQVAAVAAPVTGASWLSHCYPAILRLATNS
jgi:hypothetical protein